MAEDSGLAPQAQLRPDLFSKQSPSLDEFILYGTSMRSRTSLARLEVRRPSIGGCINGAPGEIRTHTFRVFKTLASSVGLLEHWCSVKESNFLFRRHLVYSQKQIPLCRRYVEEGIRFARMIPSVSRYTRVQAWRNNLSLPTFQFVLNFNKLKEVDRVTRGSVYVTICLGLISR